MPSPPNTSADGKPFECPYCFYIITIRDRRSWTRHVFRDLQPYACTFKTCSTFHQLYDSRHEWFEHEITRHRQEWFQERVEGGPTPNTAIPTSSIRELHANVSCPLCLRNFSSLSKIERHLAGHLEELALFAIPRRDDDNDDADGYAISAKELGDRKRSLPSDLHSETESSDSLDSPEARSASPQPQQPERSEFWPFHQSQDLPREQPPPLDPQTMQFVDRQPFPRTVLNSGHDMLIQVPGDVNSWSQLRTWVTQNVQKLPPGSLEKLVALQAIHFQRLQESRIMQRAATDPGRKPDTTFRATMSEPAVLTQYHPTRVAQHPISGRLMPVTTLNSNPQVQQPTARGIAMFRAGSPEQSIHIPDEQTRHMYWQAYAQAQAQMQAQAPAQAQAQIWPPAQFQAQAYAQMQGQGQGQGQASAPAQAQARTQVGDTNQEM